MKQKRYAHVRKIAMDFIINDSAFKFTGWSIQENRNFVILHGVLMFRKVEEVPFRVYFRKGEGDPRGTAKVVLPTTNRSRYLQSRYGIREYIEGLFYDLTTALEQNNSHKNTSV